MYDESLSSRIDAPCSGFLFADKFRVGRFANNCTRMSSSFPSAKTAKADPDGWRSKYWHNPSNSVPKYGVKLCPTTCDSNSKSSIASSSSCICIRNRHMKKWTKPTLRSSWVLEAMLISSLLALLRASRMEIIFVSGLFSFQMM